MTDSANPIYAIVFNGELIDPKLQRKDVVANLSTLTGLPEDEVLDQFFSIKPIVITESEDSAVAEVIAAKLQETGIKVQIEEHAEHAYFSLVLDIDLDEALDLPKPVTNAETAQTTKPEGASKEQEQDASKEKPSTPEEAILELRRPASAPASKQGQPAPHAHAHLHQFLAATLGVMVITIIAWLAFPYLKPQIGSAQARQAEAALVQDDTALLVHIDFKQLSRVNTLFGNPNYHRMLDHLGIGNLLADLKKKKADLLTTTDEMFVALDTAGSQNHTKWILLGDYKVDLLKKVLKKHFTVKPLQEKNSFSVTLKNNNNCDEIHSVILILDKDQLVIVDESEHQELANRLKGQDVSPAINLTFWRDYRDGRFTSLALINPQALSTLSNGISGWLPENSLTILQQLQTSYASINFDQETNRFNTDFIFNTAKIELLKKALNAWQPQQETANLYSTLTFDSTKSGLAIEGQIDRYLVDNLSLLTAQNVKALLGTEKNKIAITPTVEKINDKTAPYFAKYTEKQLPDFDPEFDAFFRPDTSSGPFGIRLNAIRTTSDNLIELEVEAAANHVENLGVHGARAKLYLDNALTANGKQLLRKENCGAHPNQKPSSLQPQLASVFSRNEYTHYRKVSGSKKIRLKADASLDQLEILKGKIVLSLPTATETILLNAPMANQYLEKKGTRIDFRQSEKHILLYDVKGKFDNILEVRALNSQKKYLSKRSTERNPHLLGTGKNYLETYEGEIAFVEVIWATAEKQLKFPFELHHFVPQTDRAWRDRPTPIKTYSLAKFRRQFKKALVPSNDIFHADSDGSFSISVFDANLPRLRVTPKEGILGRVWFKTPEIPSLNKTLSSLELQLSHIRLNNGDSVKTDFSSYVVMEKRSLQKVSYLTGHTDLRIPFDHKKSDIYSLEGELILRLPSSIDSIKLKDIELGGSVSANGFTMRLVELTRDTASVEIDGNRSRIITLRGFAPDKKQLQGFSPQLTLQPSGKWLGTISVTGKLDTIELVTALSQEQQAFPFSMNMTRKN